MADPENIRFSDHARQRCVERWIDQSDVVRIVQNPMNVIYDVKRDNFKCYGLAVDAYTREQKYLIVVYRKFNTYDLIITAMWTTAGSLTAYGFSKI